MISRRSNAILLLFVVSPEPEKILMSRVERTDTRITGFENPEMDFQLMRSLGAASFGGGEPGEIFAARRQGR